MKKFITNNSLSLVFFLLFLISLAGQIFYGLEEYNIELLEEGGPSLSLSKYLTSGHFLQSTFENWESEFLQMALFVIFTIFLQQKGSSESKDFEKEEEVDREPDPKKKDAPWPVKKGGWILTIYKYSLTIAFLLLFLFSFLFIFMVASKMKTRNCSYDHCHPKLRWNILVMHVFGSSRFKTGRANFYLSLLL